MACSRAWDRATRKSAYRYPVKEKEFLKNVKSIQAQSASARPRQKTQPLLKRAYDGIFLRGNFTPFLVLKMEQIPEAGQNPHAFCKIKTFIASLMVHPKPELPSQCHG